MPYGGSKWWFLPEKSDSPENRRCLKWHNRSWYLIYISKTWWYTWHLKLHTQSTFHWIEKNCPRNYILCPVFHSTSLLCVFTFPLPCVSTVCCRRCSWIGIICSRNCVLSSCVPFPLPCVSSVCCRGVVSGLAVNHFSTTEAVQFVWAEQSRVIHCNLVQYTMECNLIRSNTLQFVLSCTMQRYISTIRSPIFQHQKRGNLEKAPCCQHSRILHYYVDCIAPKELFLN